MIPTITLANKSMKSYSYNFFFMVRTFKISSPRNCKVYNTILLTIFTRLCLKYSLLITKYMYVLNTIQHYNMLKSPLESTH